MPPSQPAALDIVTVVYSREIPLLRLQAASFARFLAPERIGRVIVIVNDIQEAVCRDAIEALRDSYGRFADRLDIVLPDQLFALRPKALGPRGIRQRFRTWLTRHRRLYPLGVLRGWHGNRGWSVQQALKLCVARLSQAENILILDAKNHFVRPVAADTFLTPSGRPRYWQVEAPSEKQRLWIEGSFRLLGAPLPAPEAGIPPTVTPVCVPTRVLLACVDELEAQEGPSEAFFSQARGNTSEFMLLYAHVVKHHGTWEAIAEPGLARPATIHRRSGTARIAQVLDDVEAGRTDIFSVHSSQLPKLDEDIRARIIRCWRAKGLPADLLDAS